MIKIYTIENCFVCKDIMKKLKEEGVEFEELSAPDNIEYLQELNRTLLIPMTLPIILDDGKPVKIEDILKNE